ncbi:MAG: ribose-phosphate pyrophosphokinase-like domain-containing protein [Acidimicrobiales bacterium]
MSIAPSDVIVVGNFSDDPFAIDVAYAAGQTEDIADLISMKTFANTEFCPRFINDEHDLSAIGEHLVGKTVVIVSTSSLTMTRNNLAMRNLLLARAAKDNGAESVVLVEPDLYYSAQDRGPRPDQGRTSFERDEHDRKKFDGQPFSSRLYAQMLHLAGVDRVMTVHNHSVSVQAEFNDVFEGRFQNLIPYEIYADYLEKSNVVSYGTNGEGLVLCAPDKGARDFVRGMYDQLGLSEAKLITLSKERSGERSVEITLDPESDTTLDEIRSCDVVLFDDMVRTGSTVVESCEFLQKAAPNRIVFGVTHFTRAAKAARRWPTPPSTRSSRSTRSPPC